MSYDVRTCPDHGVHWETRLMAGCPLCLLEERDHYRAALVRIADANSGEWGWIAHEALKGPDGTPHPLVEGSERGADASE